MDEMCWIRRHFKHKIAAMKQQEEKKTSSSKPQQHTTRKVISIDCARKFSILHYTNVPPILFKYVVCHIRINMPYCVQMYVCVCVVLHMPMLFVWQNYCSCVVPFPLDLKKSSLFFVNEFEITNTYNGH